MFEMVCPLYAGHHVVDKLGTGHAGLWYDKFCNRWSDDWRKIEKLDWVKTVTGAPLGRGDLIKESLRRTLRLSCARRGKFGIFVTESSFITGLGRSHPVENGFVWHPTLGVPYLPASSVKGIMRAWGERDIDEERRRYVEKIFGTSGKVGRVALLDAVPVKQVRLDADVITPHYAAWSGEDLPGDWRSPVPIPFLVTAPNNAFVFSLFPLDAGREDLVDRAWFWLREALLDAGAGAKTSIGYGRFRFDDAETQTLKNQLVVEQEAIVESLRRTEAQRTPEGRWTLELSDKKEAQVLELVRIHLDKNPISDAHERRAFAEGVAARGFLVSWHQGIKCDRATQVGKDKLKERARLVQVVLEK